MKSLLASCLLLSLLSGTALASSAPAARPEVQSRTEDKTLNAESFTLANGMEVVVIPNHRAPVVTHMVWYKVGAADEPQGDGVSGVAHFLEHLMFKGSAAVAPGEFSRIIRGLGGEDNAFTSWDFTAYYQSIAREHLSKVMAFEADRMVNLRPPAAQVTSELQVVIEERRQRTDNDPRNLFSEQMRAVLYNTSPYGIPIIGWKDEMPKMIWPQMEAYYRTWYAPNNAILVVSGDVTAEELRPLAEKYYGVLKYRDVPEHIRADIPDLPAPTTMTMRHEDVREPVFIRAWRAPSYLQNRRDSLALNVLENLISSSSSTRLYQDLVVEQKVATSVDLSYDGDNRGSGSLWLSAVPAPGVSLEKLEQALETEFSTLIGNGFTADEIETAKTRLIDSVIYARDSVAGPAMIVGQAMAAGAQLEDIESWPQQIRSVRADSVQAVLTKYLSPAAPAHQPVTGYLLPKETTE